MGVENAHYVLWSFTHRVRVVESFVLLMFIDRTWLFSSQPQRRRPSLPIPTALPSYLPTISPDPVSHKHAPGAQGKSPTTGPLITFARFENERLVFLKAHTTDLVYIAISHVWGLAEWSSASMIDDKILASPSKIDFVQKSLPRLVGSTPFWMDILTMNQRNESQVVGAVASIPSIFRHASRTICVRESDGIYQCCADTVHDFLDWIDFSTKLIQHNNKHHSLHIRRESYLQRLWTLQECLLSNTLEFVIHGENQPKDSTGPSRQIYRNQTDLDILLNSLFYLAISFSGLQQVSEFVKAYVCGGSVVRREPSPPKEADDMFTTGFRSLYVMSNRVASKSRDYVLATMPQFTWYHPPAMAKQLSFNVIFRDFYDQALQSGHAFAPRFTQSMTDPTAVGSQGKTAWGPSPVQPGPANLGDFLKLMGESLPEDTKSPMDHVHLTTEVAVLDLAHADTGIVLKVLEEALEFSEMAWRVSHNGGELSRYGSFPREQWRLEIVDATSSGRFPKSPESFYQPVVRSYRKGDETAMLVGPYQEYEEDPYYDLLSHCYEDLSPEAMGEQEEVPLLQQARKILDHMCCGLHKIHNDEAQASDWKAFKDEMQYDLSTPLLQTMLLLAAMVGCHIGLSAATWVRRYFVPVAVRYKHTAVLGLLARHARTHDRTTVQHMYSVGRHPVAGDRCWKDLVLADKINRVPIGLLPDFVTENASPELHKARIRELYEGLVESEHSKGLVIKTFSFRY